MLAEYYIDTEQYEKATEILGTLLEKTPSNRSIQKYLIEVLLAQGNLAGAQGLLNALFQEDINDIELKLLRGKYHLLAQEPSYAVGYFKSIVDDEPNFPVSHYLLGLSYLTGGQIELARQSMIQALSIDKNYSDAELALADIFYKREDYDLSLDYAERVMKREPENYRSHLIMGNVYLAQRQYDKAMVKFEAAQSIHPDAISPFYYLGVISERLNQPENALKYFKILLEKNPDLVDASLRYVRLLIRRGKTDDARVFIEKAIERSPQNGFFHHIMGEVHLASGDTHLAKKSFNMAILFNPKLVTSYQMLAQVHEKDQNWKEQVQVMEACMVNVPDYSGTAVSLSQLYIRKDFIDKAITTLEAGLEKTPESTQILNNLAWLLLEQNRDLDKALGLAQSAYENLPGDPGVADTLGWAYYKKGAFEWAEMYLKEAVSIEQDNPFINFHLGMLFHAKGDKEHAMDSLERAMVLGLEGVERDEAERMMEEIRENAESQEHGAE
jgi:tetratricopeptide (TPR) repeat protein